MSERIFAAELLNDRDRLVTDDHHDYGYSFFDWPRRFMKRGGGHFSLLFQIYAQ